MNFWLQCLNQAYHRSDFFLVGNVALSEQPASCLLLCLRRKLPMFQRRSLEKVTPIVR